MASRFGLVVLAVAVCAVLSGCAPRSRFAKLDAKEYTLGVESTASVGSPILARESGRKVKHEIWLGLFGGGWQETPWRIEPGAVREELLYSGQSKGSLKLTYREFRMVRQLPQPHAYYFSQWRDEDSWQAAQAFYQEPEFDLADGPRIAFRNFAIEVIEASNSGLRYKVLSDGSAQPTTTAPVVEAAPEVFAVP